MIARLLVSLLGWLLLWGACTAVLAQTQGHEQGIPDPIPPPLPKPKPPQSAGNYTPLIGDSELPWGIEQDLLSALYEKADIYRNYTRRFECTETARLADYDNSGSVDSEKVRRYGYLLTTASEGLGVVEFRQEIGRDGKLKNELARDAEAFPPAYAWVFLFSRFNEPYFSYRYVGDRFDGFDWVHEIHFKGSLRFTEGRDIREWEGIALVDAVTFNPIEIRAEPAGQDERIGALYRRWSSSFNVLGMRTAPRPLAYRAVVNFRFKREGLSFPTSLRYDTMKAVAPRQVVQTRASIREYRDYRFIKVRDRPLGEPEPLTPAADGNAPE